MVTKAFSGGERLEAFLQELADKVSRPGTLQVGFLGGATYPDGTPVAYVAAINEFGRSDHNQPPRPFFRSMIADKSPTWGNAVATQLRRYDYDGTTALERVGAGIAGQLRESIQQLSSPPLAPSTVARKGFNKPLVDTGHMLNSVDSEVIT